MDIFSHGLWAAAAAKGVNKSQNKRRVNVWAMAMWGVFPDLFHANTPSRKRGDGVSFCI